ncbi:MAG: hypothetical protein JWO38_6968 [Gemmataceae bacterium]|nr:hypothetical protein [Gemmataceae bacterium]
MCFSAEASLGVAIALLPTGAYCVEAAWRKDRRYFPLAVVPVLFGLQQLCEAQVWVGLGRGNPEMARVASLRYLFFALAFWPVWVPLSLAAVEPGGRKRRVLVALAGVGVLFGVVCYLPVAADGGRGLDPVAVGHSIRYDFSAVPATRWAGSWVWPALYLVSVAGPLLASRDRRLCPLGAAVALSAVAAYALFEYAFASVWCFLAAVLSLHLAYVLSRLPGPPGIPAPDMHPAPSN